MHLVEERGTAEDTADALGDAVVALVRAYRHAIRHPVASALPALALARHPDDDVRAATRLVRALADELDHRTAQHGAAALAEGSIR